MAKSNPEAWTLEERIADSPVDDPTSLIRAIRNAERIAKLIELGRLDDASREFLSPDCRRVLVQALNSQQPKHLSNPQYRHLHGLLKALAQLKSPYTGVTAAPRKIRSYCRDITREIEEAGVTRHGPAELPDDLQALIRDLPLDNTPGLREAYRRDHLWSKWNVNRFGPAKIRDRWNSLLEAHRRIISPRLPHTVGKDNSGAATVKEGIRKARKEAKDNPSSARKRSSRSRSLKKV